MARAGARVPLKEARKQPFCLSPMADVPLSTGNFVLGLERRVEARRSSRIGAHLWVRVGGVDSAARLRIANLSVTGLYIATDEAVGSPGDLVWLGVATEDKARSAQVVARVARVMRQDDRHRGAAVVGAGFELLPLDQPLPEVVDLVRHAAELTLRSTGALPLDRSSSARLRRASGAAIVAHPCSLHRDRIVLATFGLPAPGEAVRLEVAGGDGTDVAVKGTVVTVDADPAGAEGSPSNRVTVRFDSDGPTGWNACGTRAASSLIDALIAPAKLDSPPPRLQRLSGQLDRVQLSTLLALAESTALDGIVTLANETTAARIYLSRGRIVDAEADVAGLTPSQVVGELLTWTSGEFSLCPVEGRRSQPPGARRPSLVEDLRVLTVRPAT